MTVTRRFIRPLLVALAACAVLAACATGPRVRTDYDPTANFAQYKTWGWYSPIAMEQGLRFAIREGGRTVGAGVVAKIIE